MANPTEIAISKPNYIRGEQIVITLINPDPAVYHTYDFGFGNGAGQGFGASGVVPQDSDSPEAPVPDGTTITFPTGAGWATDRFFSLTLHTWRNNPNPDGVYGTGDDDFTDGNLIGSRRVSAQLFPSAEDAPNITSLGLSDGNAAVTAAAIGAYVQGVSTLKWNIDATPGAGATITAATLEFSEVVYPSRTGQTPALSASGTISVTGTITNSRGETATRTESITVLAREAPKVTSLLAYRSTSGGVEDDNGTYVRLNFAGTVSPLTVGTQKNRTTYTLRTRPRGGTTWTTRASITNSTNLSPSSTVTPSGYPMGTAYEVRVDISDRFGASAAVTYVSKGGVLMDWGEGSLGLGKRWERGTLDVGGDGYFEGGVFSIPTFIADANEAKYAGTWHIYGTDSNVPSGLGAVYRLTVDRMPNFSGQNVDFLFQRLSDLLGETSWIRNGVVNPATGATSLWGPWEVEFISLREYDCSPVGLPSSMVTAKYGQRGKQISYEVEFVRTSAGAPTDTVSLTLPLPPATATQRNMGMGSFLLGNNSSMYVVTARYTGDPGGRFNINFPNNAGSAMAHGSNLSATYPTSAAHTLGTSLVISGEYTAAQA